MINRLYKTFLLGLFLFAYFQAQEKPLQLRFFPETDSINIILNSKLTTLSGNFQSEDSVYNKVQSLLNNEGFFTFIIKNLNIVQTNNINRVNIEIKCKEQAEISNVNVLFSNPVDTTEIKSKIEEMEGTKFSTNNLDSSFNKLVTEYKEKGFSGFQLEIISVLLLNKENKDFVEISVEINPGRKILVSDIEFPLIGKNYDGYLKKLTGFSPFEFNDVTINEIKRKIESKNVFSVDSSYSLQFKDSLNARLIMPVNEKNTSYFNGVIGYVPGNKNSNAYITGLFALQLSNFIGPGRELQFSWKRETATTQEIFIKYKEPYIFNSSFSSTVIFSQFKYDTLYIKNNLELQLDYQVTSGFSLSGIIEITSVTPGLNSLSIRKSDYFSSGAGFLYETRDNIIFPRNGLMSRNYYKYVSKKNVINKDNFQVFEAKAEFHKEIFTNNVLATKITFNTTTLEKPELSDLYFIGGTNTVRGYKEKQFYGDLVLYFNLEYKYIFNDNSQVFVFGDFGFFSNKNSVAGEVLKKEFIYGYGFGVAILTPVGLTTISYAIGKNDTFANGKIHLGITSGF